MQRCRYELSTGQQIWFHVKSRECGLAHRGETGRSRTIRSQVASPSGSQTTLISSSSPTELFSHLGDVLMRFLATERSTIMESHLDEAGFRIIVPMLSSIPSRQSESQ